MEKKRVKDKLTILIDKEIKDNYKEHCNSRGLVIGKQIEFLISAELEKAKKEVRKKDG